MGTGSPRRCPMGARKQFTPEFKREAVQLLEKWESPSLRDRPRASDCSQSALQVADQLRARGAGVFPGSGARNERTGRERTGTFWFSASLAVASPPSSFWCNAGVSSPPMRFPSGLAIEHQVDGTIRPSVSLELYRRDKGSQVQPDQRVQTEEPLRRTMGNFE